MVESKQVGQPAKDEPTYTLTEGQLKVFQRLYAAYKSVHARNVGVDIETSTEGKLDHKTIRENAGTLLSQFGLDPNISPWGVIKTKVQGA